MIRHKGGQVEHARFQFDKVRTSQPRHQADPGCQRCQHCFLRRRQDVALLSNASGEAPDTAEQQAEQKRGSLCP